MKVAIMQPYLFPYIGYFQLVNSVDKFVIYDNIQYTKKGWISRNRILQSGKDEFINIPLKKGSDYLNINQRFLADNAGQEIDKTLRKIENCYRKAPYFHDVFPIVISLMKTNQTNLFDFIYNSVITLCNTLEIGTEIVVSSTIDVNVNLKGQDKVIAICKALNASHYINAIGGMELYSQEAFRKNDLKLSFIKSNSIVYPQFQHEFVPWLSIIDVMMFNQRAEISKMLTLYTLQ